MRKKITSVLIIVLCVLMAVPWGVFAQAVNAEKKTNQTQQQTTAPTPTPETTAPAAEPTPEPTPEQPAEAPAEQRDESVSTLADYPAGRAVLDTGENVNMAIKELSGQYNGVSDFNKTIKAILRSNSPAPSDVTTENLSVSNVPVTAWWDSSSETIYWYSQDPKPMLNADSSSMFDKLEALTRVDLSHFETSNVTNMHSMFYHCDGLTSLDVSHFDTSKVTNMYSMFYYCNGLTSLDVSHFDTSNVTNMAYMFYYCMKLTDLDLSHFDTSKVTHMYSMFNSCKSLAKLDVSSFDTSKVIYFDGVFENCEKLKTIYASEKFTTANVDKSIRYTYENMFKNCTALVGGNGTAHDVNHVDAEYARIDKAGQPGYFTNKKSSVIPTPIMPIATDDKPSGEQAIAYRTHVQNVGWQPYVTNGTMAGTSGQSLRLEGMNINLQNQKYAGDIEYRTHIQNIGWENEWKKNDVMSGTSNQSLRLEAMQVRLTGEMANHYDVYYRVHAQNFGWLNWAKNGEQSGTAGYAYRLEGMQIMLVNKGGAAPSIAPNSQQDKPFVEKYKDDVKADSLIAYQTHVQNVGWQNYAVDGGTAGTSGLSYRLEGMKISLNNPKYTGDIEYRTHIQNIGWENEWKKNDVMSGTSGQALRLEAMQVRLTGEMAEKYDVYYRVHAQNFGWLGWAKNGEESGTAGYGYRLEAMQIVLVNKGGAAPNITPACNDERAFVDKNQKADDPTNPYMTREAWITDLLTRTNQMPSGTVDTYQVSDAATADNPNVVETAYAMGILPSYAQKTFSPKMGATREFMAYTAVHALKYQIDPSKQPVASWSDSSKIRGLAEAVLASDLGIVTSSSFAYFPDRNGSESEVKQAQNKISEIKASEDVTEEKAEIEYADGVEENHLPFILDQENQTVTFDSGSEADSWKPGEKHALLNEADSTQNIAIIVKSIEIQNGKTIVHYEKPEANTIVENMDVRGSETEQGTLKLAEGVTVENDAGIMTMEDGSINLFEEMNFGIKVDDVKFNCNINFKRLDYAYEIEWFKLTSAKAVLHTDITPSISLSKKISKDITIGEVTVPTQCGVCITGRVYLKLDMNGKVTASFVIENKAGLEYESNQVRSVFENNFKRPTIQMSASFSVAAGFELNINFLDCVDLIAGSIEVGEKINGNGELYSVPGANGPFYCLDAKGFLFCTLSFHVGPEEWNLKCELNFLDEKNSPDRWHKHFEETGIVEECTRYTGNLAGTVTDGQTGKPLFNVAVKAKENGGNKTKTEYTDSSGHYQIDNLKMGECQLTFTKNGYKKTEKTCVINQKVTTQTDAALEPGESGGSDPIIDPTKKVIATGYCNSEKSVKFNIYDDYTMVISGNGIVVSCFYSFTGNISRSKIQSVIMQNGITKIEYNAFSDCTSLQSVTIPNSVTEIGDEAFRDCTSLQSVTIPNSVTEIGDYTFRDCTSLQSVTISNGVSKIGYSAFSGCSSLQEVELPDDLTSLSSRLFSDCSSLQNITLPNNLTSIGDSTFSGCTSLKSITLPNNLTSIGDATFWGCTSLKSIIIPDNVTEIGRSVFNDCIELHNVSLSNKLSRIPWYTFKGCTSLPSITIPSNVGSVESFAFEGCSSLKNVYGMTNNDDALPKNVENITLSNKVTDITDCEYQDYKSLKSITIPNTVKTIGYCAFNECSALKEIRIPDSVETIERDAFNQCSSLQEVKMSNNMTEIQNHTFGGCISLKRIVLPNKLSKIGDDAFIGCHVLTEISFPNTLTEIGNGSFYGCESLESINIPINVKTIGGEAFGKCKSLKVLKIPNGVSKIGHGAFLDCDSLEKIEIPSSVTVLEYDAFNSCDNLKEIMIQNGLTEIDQVFYNDKSLEKITIPNSVININYFEFRDCPNLTIYGELGSYAEKYAKDHNINFISVR